MRGAYADTMKGLVAVDLDGTLLDSSGKVSPRNIKAFCDLRDAGYKVVPATGRSWRESRRVFEVINATGMAVTSGGSVLSDAATGKTIERIVIDPALVRRLTLALLERGLLAHLLRDHDSSCHDYCLVGTGQVNPATEWWLKAHEVDVRRVDTIDDLKKLGFDHYLNTEGGFEIYRKDYFEKFGVKLNFMHDNYSESLYQSQTEKKPFKLSILDNLMNFSKSEVKNQILDYRLF